MPNLSPDHTDSAVARGFVQHERIAVLFPDLHPPLTAQAAVIESNRCLNCFDAPCTNACPTQIDVPRFIKKIASGNLRGSAMSILEANVLAGSCARVCPVQVLCEGACVMHHDQQQPIAIAKLQRHAMDAFHAAGGSLPLKSDVTRPQKIACIGAGPASLAAAAELRQRGLQVVVFDRRALPGGLNTYGVAEYKLTTAESLREVRMIEELGVEFRMGVSVESEAALVELEREFDAIFLGVGLGPMHMLPIPGANGARVVDALKFIEDYKLGRTTEVTGAVVVVGAGNTAIDAACAARRLGAADVRILYRRAQATISAFGFEYEHAKQEGVSFMWLTQPVAVHGDSVECVRMELAEDGSPIEVAGSNFHLPCDLLIPAIGQSPLMEFLAQCRGVEVARGRVVTSATSGQTANPKYYAGGDCVNGGREVVDAVADGKRAALAIAERFGALHD